MIKKLLLTLSIVMVTKGVYAQEKENCVVPLDIQYQQAENNAELFQDFINQLSDMISSFGTSASDILSPAFTSSNGKTYVITPDPMTSNVFYITLADDDNDQQAKKTSDHCYSEGRSRMQLKISIRP